MSNQDRTYDGILLLRDTLQSWPCYQDGRGLLSLSITVTSQSWTSVCMRKRAESVTGRSWLVCGKCSFSVKQFQWMEYERVMVSLGHWWNPQSVSTLIGTLHFCSQLLNIRMTKGSVIFTGHGCWCWCCCCQIYLERQNFRNPVKKNDMEGSPMRTVVDPNALEIQMVPFCLFIQL